MIISSSPSTSMVPDIPGDDLKQPVDDFMYPYQGFQGFIHNPQDLLRQLLFSKEILRCNEENLQGSNRVLADHWEYQR